MMILEKIIFFLFLLTDEISYFFLIDCIHRVFFLKFLLLFFLLHMHVSYGAEIWYNRISFGQSSGHSLILFVQTCFASLS